MQNFGYAALQIIPSMRGARGAIESELNGVAGGAGDSAGNTFGSRFLDGLTTWAKRGALVIGGIATAVGAMAVKGGITRALDTEDAIVQMRRMGLEVEQVDALIDGVDRTFDGTIFSNPQGFKLAGLLHGTNVELDKIPGVIGTISDFAAHGNVPLEQMGDIFLQVIGSGRVGADIFNRLTAAGVPIEQLAMTLGMTSGEMRKLASDGEFTAEMFLEATAGAEMFQGAASSAGDTTRGAFSNALTQIRVLGQQLVNPLFGENGPMVNFFKSVRGALIGIRPMFAAAGEAIGAVFVPMLASASEWLDRLPEALESARTRMDQGYKGLVALFSDGEFTTALRLAFGWEEDAPVVDVMLRIRDGYVGLVDLIANGNFSAELRNAFGWEEDSAIVGFILGVRDALSSAGDIFGTILGVIQPVASAFLDALAPAFDQMGGSLGAVISGLSPMGAVFQSLQPILPTITDALVAIAGALGGALATILPTIAGLLTTVAGVFADVLAAVLPTIVDIVLALADAFSVIVPVVAEVAGVIVSALATGLSQILPLLADLVLALVSALAPVLPTIASAIASVAQVFAGLLTTALGAILPVLIELVAVLVSALGPVLPVLSTYIEYLAAVFGAVFQSIVPLLPVLLGFVEMILGALLPVLPALIDLVVIVVDVFLQLLIALTPLLPTIANLVAIVLELALTVLTPIIGIIAEVASVLATVLAVALEAIMPIVTGVIGIVAAFAEVLSGVVAGAVQFIGGIIRTVWNTIQSVTSAVWSGIRNVIMGVANAISSGVSAVFSTVRDFISNTWRGVQTLTTNAWQSLRTAVSNGVNRAVSVVRELPRRAREALSNIGSALLNAGRNLISGFIDGITGAFGRVRDKLSELTSFLPDWKGPPSRDRTILRGAGGLIMDGFVDGLAGGFGAVEDTLGGITDLIAGYDMPTLTVGVELDDQVDPAGLEAPTVRAPYMPAPDYGPGSTGLGGPLGRTVNVNVVNHNPVAEPESVAVNKALQFAAAVGV